MGASYIFLSAVQTRAWGVLVEGGSFTSSDPMWLAVYFATLAPALGFMSDEDFGRSGAPLDSRAQLTRKWYSAALFYLDQGDFLQKSNIRVVQAIAVLGNLVGKPFISIYRVTFPLIQDTINRPQPSAKRIDTPIYGQ